MGRGGLHRLGRNRTLPFGEQHDLRAASYIGEARRGACHDMGKAGGQQVPPPARHVEQRAMRQPPRRIGRAPPAIQQAECQGGEVLGHRHLIDQQKPAGPQHARDMPERFLDIAGCVQDVRGNDDIEAGRIDPLVGRVLLDIQDGEAHAGV